MIDRNYSPGGNSSARHQSFYERPNEYNLSGGSPLVSKRHGSTSNLHEPSPGRFMDDGHSAHSGGSRRSAGQHYRSSSYNRGAAAEDHSMSYVSVSKAPQVGASMYHTGGARIDRIELDEFIKALKEIIFSEREVESTKIELALKSDFNVIDAFKMLDARGSGALTQ